MTEILRNRRVQVALAVFVIALGIIFFNGLTFGVDFSGGTRFSIQLSDPIVDAAQKEQVRNIIQARLDFSGLKDASVRVVGDRLVEAEIAETNPAEIEQLEKVLLRQGKFESILDGNVMFTGNEIQSVSRDPQHGYGISQVTPTQFHWVLPFTLSDEAGRRFTTMSFHQCTASSFDSTGKPTYDCKKTYFFIDRPQKSILVYSLKQYNSDRDALLIGNTNAGIPSQTSLEEVLLNAQLPYFILDENSSFSAADQNRLTALLATNPNLIFASDAATPALLQQVSDLGFPTPRVVMPTPSIPWTWSVTGLRQIISLSETVTNLEPYVESIDSPNLQIYASLIIQGYGDSSDAATADLKGLTTLLETGSLPVSVDNVSRETISPSLGSEFLRTVTIIALLAAIGVALFLFWRYRVPGLVVPMFATVVMEAVLTLGVAAFLRIPLDLGALAGIIAAIGYGVDDQIVMTDELRKKRGADGEHDGGSLIARAKRAFFIVTASAVTAIAALLPLILIGPSSGMSKLVGFALTTIIGVLVGVIVTRPAYNEVAKIVLQKLENR